MDVIVFSYLFLPLDRCLRTYSDLLSHRWNVAAIGATLVRSSIVRLVIDVPTNPAPVFLESKEGPTKMVLLSPV